ncbi:MAG: rod shape-determining protein MreC [Clostridia bacterium]|nr:rod shape-determining protein MreC [Clostridia bacterium]
MRLFHSRLFWFAVVIVAICLSLMIWTAATGRNSFVTDLVGAVVTPLQNGVSKVTDKASGLFGYFYRYSALEQENEALKEQLNAYQRMENEYYSAISQNSALREAAGIRAKRADFELELCTVVASAGSGFQSALTLSRGSLSGIEKGDPVITGGGLVGFVSEVGLSYCTVTTLINADFTASALVSRTREVVAAQGNFELAAEGMLKLPYLENDADIRVGDRIFTNGGTYPPDLIIGRVTDFRPETHGISSYAVVEPAVKADELSTVFVIKDFTVED